MAVRVHEDYLPGDLVTYQVATDISDSQYHMVEVESDAQVDVADAASDLIAGILTNKPTKEGAAATVMSTPGKIVKALCDGNSVNIAVNDYLGPSSSGHVIKKTTGTYYARALEAVASDGHIVPVLWVGPTTI